MPSGFAKFMIPEASILMPYATAPLSEVSAYKNIPIEYLEQVRWILKQVTQIDGVRYRIRYRGPRRRGPDGRVTYDGRQDCVKRDAVRFSVYPV